MLIMAYMCCYCGGGDHSVAGCPWTHFGRIARPSIDGG